MGALFDLVGWLLDLVVPDRDPRQRRLQRLGCFMFGGLGLLVLGFAVFEVLGGG